MVTNCLIPLMLIRRVSATLLGILWPLAVLKGRVVLQAVEPIKSNRYKIFLPMLSDEWDLKTKMLTRVNRLLDSFFTSRRPENPSFNWTYASFRYSTKWYGRGQNVTCLGPESIQFDRRTSHFFDGDASALPFKVSNGISIITIHAISTKPNTAIIRC